MRKLKNFIRSATTLVSDAADIIAAGKLDYGRPLDPRLAQRESELISIHDCVYASEFSEVFFSRFIARPGSLKAAIDDVISEFPDVVEKAVVEWRSEYTIYGKTTPALGRQPPWRLDHQVSDDDVLFAVRVHRFAFLPRLVLAVIDEQISAAEIERLLTDWCDFAAKRRSRKKAFVSSLLIVQRGLAIVWAYAMLMAMGRNSYQRLAALLLKILRTDLEIISPELGTAAPNNHLLVDYFAGWFFGQIFDDVFTRHWGERFDRLFVEELCRQVLSDGTGFENSTHYHEFYLEAASMYVRLRRKNGCREPAAVTSRVEKMLQFKLATCPVQFGNGTEDPLFPLVSDDTIPISTWIRLASDLGVVRDPKTLEDSKVDDWYSVLMEQVHRCEAASMHRSLGLLNVFPDGGYVTSYDERTGTNLVFRTGPSDRSRVIAGHSHADVLSVNISRRGSGILVDPGTYTYRYHPGSDSQASNDWRSYFMGPQAHNNVTIDGIDPLGPVSADFRDRSYPVEAQYTIAVADRSVALMKSRLRGTGVYDGVFRSIIHRLGEYYLIVDLVPTEIAHGEVCSSYQFSERFSPRVLGDRNITLSDKDEEWTLSICDGGGKAAHFRGTADPVAGWVSSRYGSRTPGSQFRIPFGPSRLQAVVISRGAVEKRVGVEFAGDANDTIRVDVHCGEGRSDRYLICTKGDVQEFREAPITKEGHLWYGMGEGEFSDVI